jgi:uncharacterized membrane protein YdcZ (DUF606 family)
MTPWYRNPVLTFVIGWLVGTITLFVVWLIAVGSIEAPTSSAKTEKSSDE